MEIRWHDMDAISPATRQQIEARLQRLAAQHGDLIDVKISGQETPHHHLGAKRARIACQARGRRVVATREAETIEAASHEVVDVFERELRKLRSRRRTPPQAVVAPPPSNA